LKDVGIEVSVLLLVDDPILWREEAFDFADDVHSF